MPYQSLEIKEGSYKDIKHLIKDQWEELNPLKEVFPLDPDYALLDLLESNNVSFTLLVIIDNNIVGYSLNTVTNHLNSLSTKYCTNIYLYLDKEYRKGSTGIKLIKATENKAKELDCKCIIWKALPNTSLDRIMKHNAELLESSYLKEL